ncbi:MAG TPA: hypothetical protein VJL89_07980 [Thermodesulfovibrionia bacterium]|nr:hypothetical protein [Thermodesulfovibrionia bacterium]
MLYEVNLIHTIKLDFKWQQKEALLIILTKPEAKDIKEMLERRTGIYSSFRTSILSLIERLSGGNPRQAVRLFAEFEYAYEKLNMPKDDAVKYACDRVRNDFLRTANEHFSLSLLKTIKRDGFFIPSDDRPLYWNWVIAIDEPALGRIPVKINPLLLPAVEVFEEKEIEEPELHKLKQWALAHDVSPFGLTIPAHMTYGGFIDEMVKTELMEPALSIEEIFNKLASFFLEARFNSLYFILYENLQTAKLASDYICGRAGVIGEKFFIEKTIDRTITSFTIFRDFLKDYHGLSLFFDESLTEEDITWCEIKRDQLLNKRIIFWARRDKGLSFLNVWPHLRQFFRVLQLESEIRKDLSVDALKDDLELLKDATISDEKMRIVKDKLKAVLHFLTKGASQNV